MSEYEGANKSSENNTRKSAPKTNGSNASSEPFYIKVADEENDDPIELPVENDGLLLVSTLSAQYPGASGLKFRSATGAFRGLRLDSDGKLHPPSAEDGWGSRTYIAVFPKENTKRKMDDHVDASGATKLKRIERKKCSDLIVLGLPYHTTEEDLREYFEQFGEITVAQIKRDIKTSKSKGFGFIRFAEYDSQLKAMSQRHNIDGRWCDAKIPISKYENTNPASRKVFVGRIDESISGNDLKDHFQQFGEVTDVFIPKPFRGFAFVQFSEPETAEALCGEEFIIKGCSVNVSPAVPKEPPATARNQSVGMGRYNKPQLRDYDNLGRPPAVGAYGRSPGDNSRHSGRLSVDPYNRRRDTVDDFYYGQTTVVPGGASARMYTNERPGRSSPFPQDHKAWDSYAGSGYSNMNAGTNYGNPVWDVQLAAHQQSHMARSTTPLGPQGRPMAAGAPNVQQPYISATAAHQQQQQQQQQKQHQSVAATNQATAGMGALNLNSLINPNLLAAAAQACLIAAASGGGSGNTDFTALLNNLQMQQSNSNPAQANAGGQGSWWPVVSNNSDITAAPDVNCNRGNNTTPPAGDTFREESWR